MREEEALASSSSSHRHHTNMILFDYALFNGTYFFLWIIRTRSHEQSASCTKIKVSIYSFNNSLCVKFFSPNAPLYEKFLSDLFSEARFDNLIFFHINTLIKMLHEHRRRHIYEL